MTKQNNDRPVLNEKALNPIKRQLKRIEDLHSRAATATSTIHDADQPAASTATFSNKKSRRSKIKQYDLNQSQADMAEAIEEDHKKYDKEDLELRKLHGTSDWDQIKTEVRINGYQLKYGISSHKARAAMRAAYLLSMTLEQCDPNSKNLKLFFYMDYMQTRYFRLKQYKSDRSETILRIMARYVLNTYSGDLQRQILLSDYAIFILNELLAEVKKPRHRPSHNDDNDIVRAKSVACEYIRLADAKGISDLTPYKTVSSAFKVVRKTVENWVALHSSPKNRAEVVQRVIQLRPDPLSALLEQGEIYQARAKKSR